jgi:hypothetical protein
MGRVGRTNRGNGDVTRCVERANRACRLINLKTAKALGFESAAYSARPRRRRSSEARVI